MFKFRLANLTRSGYATLGSAIAIFLLIYLTDIVNYPLIMAPFGASCVILFALPEAPLAQPKNVVFGHFITALSGMVAAHFLPITPLTIALATGVGVGLMALTNTVHPPAGANPLVVLLAGSAGVPGWSFLLFPVLSGAILLVVIASLYHPFTTRAYTHPFLPKILKSRAEQSRAEDDMSGVYLKHQVCKPYYV